MSEEGTSIIDERHNLSREILRLRTFREGFVAGVECWGAKPFGWGAYERGYRAGVLFREAVSGKRQWPPASYFPAWPGTYARWIQRLGMRGCTSAGDGL
jgi:hypothetical protein